MAAALRASMRQMAAGLPFVAAFVVLFWPAFGWLAQRFDAQNSFYSHGWLIPLAGAWLIWQRRERLASVTPRTSYGGLALLVPAAAIHVIATWWGINFLSGFAMIGAVWGLVWTLWGRQTLWTLRFPMLFLLFMIPLPGVLLISASFYLKLFAASLATQVIALIGIPVQQAGSTMLVPGITVLVDDTCSGLRSLISLIALSTFWTAFMPAATARWKKLTIVAAAVPIALLANLVRIVALVLIALIFGTEVAAGFIHYGSGVVVFGIALLTLAWLNQRLQRW